MVVMLCGPVPLLIRELLGVPLRPLLARVAAPWLLAAGPAAALFAGLGWRPAGLGEAAGWCAGYVAVYAALAWRWLLAPQERADLLGRLGLTWGRPRMPGGAEGRA
jgi:hypothetical protein